MWRGRPLQSFVGLIDIHLCEVDLVGEALDIMGDLGVEGDLFFELLVSLEVLLIKAVEEGLEHGLEGGCALVHGR